MRTKLRIGWVACLGTDENEDEDRDDGNRDGDWAFEWGGVLEGLMFRSIKYI